MDEEIIAMKIKLSFSSTTATICYGILAGLMLTGAQLIHSFIHEVLGHGLFGIIMGLRFTGAYLSPFGGYADVIGNTTHLLAAADSLAGIFMSAAVGLLILLVVYPKFKGSSFHFRLFLLLLVTALESDLFYGFFSPILGVGDAYSTSYILGIPPLAVLLAFLPFIFLIWYAVFRRFLDLTAPYAMRVSGLRSRFMLLLKAIVLPVIFYAAFLFVWGMFVYGVDYTLLLEFLGVLEISFVIFLALISSAKPLGKYKIAPSSYVQRALYSMAGYAAICVIATIAVTLAFAFLQVSPLPYINSTSVLLAFL